MSVINSHVFLLAGPAKLIMSGNDDDKVGHGEKSPGKGDLSHHDRSSYSANMVPDNRHRSRSPR